MFVLCMPIVPGITAFQDYLMLTFSFIYFCILIIFAPVITPVLCVYNNLFLFGTVTNVSIDITRVSSS